MFSYPLVMRFFGIDEASLINQLSSVLNKLASPYRLTIDHYELVLTVLSGNCTASQLFQAVKRSTSHRLVGAGNRSLAKVVGNQLIQHHLTATGAESLTCGMFQSLLGRVPGISNVFPGGFVTYSNAAKHQLLGIPIRIIEHYGVVSKVVAEWMASQSRKLMRTDFSVSFTGVAGPDSLEGYSAGTVWIGLATKKRIFAKLYHLKGLYLALNSYDNLAQIRTRARNGIRCLSAKFGLKMLEDLINRKTGDGIID